MENKTNKKMKLTKDEKMEYIKNMKYYNRLAYLIISFNQGLGSISELAVQYYFKDELHIEPARLSQIFSLILIPWTIKPFFGMITDLFPIYGYRRKIYIMLCGIFCVMSWLSMSFYINTLWGAILCLLIINICVSFSTVLGEAIVVELSQLQKVNSSSSAKDYVSLFFFCKYCGGLLSAYLKGLFVEIMPIRRVFLIASFLPWLIVTAGYMLVEVKVNEKMEESEEEENKLINDEIRDDYYFNSETPKLKQKENLENKNPYAKIIEKDPNYNTFSSKSKKTDFIKDQESEGLTTACTSNNAYVSPLNDKHSTNINDLILNDNMNALNSNIPQNKTEFIHNSNDIENYDDSLDCIFNPKPNLSPCQLLTEFGNFICKKYVFVPTLFIIILMATPSYGDPYFYFLTNELKFSASSLGKISFCSTAATLLAIWLYRAYFKDTKFKSMITIGTIVSFIFSFMAFLSVERFNIKIGIPDFWFVLFSSSFLSMIGELVMMPMLALACLLCPKNLEGTVYALFMSALNLGGILSGLFGSFFTTSLGITSKNYSNLQYLILISNILTLVPLPALLCISDSYFEPEKKKHEEINEEAENKENIDVKYDYEYLENENKKSNMNKTEKDTCVNVNMHDTKS